MRPLGNIIGGKDTSAWELKDGEEDGVGEIKSRILIMIIGRKEGNCFGLTLGLPTVLCCYISTTIVCSEN